MAKRKKTSNDLQNTIQKTKDPATHTATCVLDIILCDKVYHQLAAGQWFSPGTSVSSTKKTDRHDITEILLKVALNTINLTLKILLETAIRSRSQLPYDHDHNCHAIMITTAMRS
jgi:hypothetical protein